MFTTIKNIHFIGIGGIGMSGIAEILLNQGFNVSGSDLAENENTLYLENIGAKVFYGHNPENVHNAEVVVYSSAVKIDKNPETLEAKNLGIPLIRRAEMLAEVTRLNYCIAISGTHGKTSTTSMIGLILIKANIDPTVIVGGRLKDFGGTNARLGKGEWTVVEADEYDRSFLQLLPTIAVVNNIEAEHLDIYKDIDDLLDTFTKFTEKVPFYGFVALGTDDNGVKEILPRLNKKIVTYGLSRNNDFFAKNITAKNNTSEFDLYENGDFQQRIKLKVPGEHNIKNALASITVARKMGIDYETICSALQEFTGVYRRFDIKGEARGIIVVDDYAHHPSEIKATLEGARKGWDRRIVAVFQPHTYTRTLSFYKEFAQSFDEADILIVTDIYPARELPIEGVTGELIANQAQKYGHRNVIFIQNFDEIQPKLIEILLKNDLLITIGAGSIYRIADQIFEHLSNKE
ncbi:MAG: UDP-N-acetylmuramate--L-alanine ligase [Ignavibacteria bacterium GWF2_33_9]|nr:MAG: UDP-N-acetylmuramate--L-alanine ligase [Ignavibacteria bacterium GWF2_33_9]